MVEVVTGVSPFSCDGQLRKGKFGVRVDLLYTFLYKTPWFLYFPEKKKKNKEEDEKEMEKYICRITTGELESWTRTSDIG